MLAPPRMRSVTSMAATRRQWLRPLRSHPPPPKWRTRAESVWKNWASRASPVRTRPSLAANASQPTTPTADPSGSSRRVRHGSGRAYISSSCSRPRARAAPAPSECQNRTPAGAARTSGGTCGSQRAWSRPRAWPRLTPDAGSQTQSVGALGNLRARASGTTTLPKPAARSASCWRRTVSR